MSHVVVIRSLTDLRNWLEASNLGGRCMTHEEVTDVATAIEASAHPPYGDDWMPWLAEQGKRIAVDTMWERDFIQAHSDPDTGMCAVWAL